MRTHPLLDAPNQLTQAASDFYEQHQINIVQFSISEMIAVDHEDFLTTTGRVLSTDGQAPREVFPGNFAQLDSLKRLVDETVTPRLEVAMSRTMDNFLAYVSDILTQAITATPRLLTSKEQVTLEEVLEHDSLDEFVQWAAERRVNQLSFKGLGSISDYVEKRLGLKLISAEQDRETLVRSVAIRNIIVHRRAIIDDRFLKVFGDATLHKGEKYEVGREMLASTMKCAIRAVRDFDARVAEKFNLPLIPTAEQSWFQRIQAPDQTTGDANGSTDDNRETANKAPQTPSDGQP